MRVFVTLLVRARGPLFALLGLAAAAAATFIVLGTTHATASTTCNYFWTGKDPATPTVWNDKKNWSLTDGGAASTTLPNGTSYACMSTSPTTSTAVITANTNVGGLNWPTVGTLNASGGTFTIGAVGPSTIQSLQLEGGTLSGTASVATASLDSGTLKSGAITLTGSSTIGAPTVSDHVINAGTLTHSGDTGFIYLAGATAFLENSGTFNEQNGYYGVDWDSTSGGQVVNDGGATWTLNVSPSDPNYPTTYIYAPFQNNGTVAAPSGLLNLQAGDPGTSTDAGTWQGPNAGSGIILAAGNRTEAASMTTSGPGAFDVTGATVTFTAGSSLSTLSLDGGTVEGTTSVANATLNSGTLAAPGTITLTGTSTIGAPTVSGHLTNAGTLTHSGDTGLIYMAGATAFLENSGTFNEQNGYYGVDWDGTSGGQVVNDAGATWTLNVSPSDPNYPTTYIFAPFQNNGTVAAPSGLLNLEAGDPGTATDAGTWQGPNAGSGIVLAAGNRTEGASVTTSGPGAFDVTGATVTFTAGSTLSTLSLDGGTVQGTTSVVNATLNSGTLAAPGTITLTGTSTVGGFTMSDHLINAGTLTHSGDTGFIYLTGATAFLENSGTFNEQNGYFGVDWDGTSGGQVVNDAGATWTLNVSHSDPNYPNTNIYAPLQNNGTLTAHSGTLVLSTLSNLNGGTTLTGGTYTTSGGSLEISGDVTTNAATITLGTSGSILDASAANALTGLTSNSGTLSLGQSLTITGALANSGHVSVTGGKLKVSSYSQSGSTSTTSVASGATLQAGGGSAAITINGGTLSGNGTVAGAISGGGTVQPGPPTGTLTDTSTYSAAAGGTLATEIGSGGATKLAVTGAATLSGGTLAITTDTGFTPSVGTVYTVLTSSAVSGAFGTITGLPATSAGYGYQVGYSSTAVTVTVIPTVSISNANAAQQPSSNSTATFTATLSGAFTQSVSVNYSTADGSAVAGTDYTAATGTVTFPSGITSEQVNVTVLPDATCDPDETFTVTLSTPVNTVINQGTGTGTITNAAPCVTVTSVTPNHVGKGATAFAVTVNGSGYSATAANDTVTVSGTGVTATVTSATTTTLSVKLKVAASAALGAHDVTVTTGGNNATCTGCLTVDAAPVVTSLSPNVLATGATSVPVTLTGSNFTAPAKVTFKGPSGSPKVTAKVTSVSSTSLSLTVTVGQGTVASNVPYTVKVTNGDGGVGSKASAFTVEQGPTLTQVNPNSVVRGAASVPVTLTGTGFFSGMTVVAPHGVTITITSVSLDGTTASGTMKASSTAPTGTSLPVTVVEPAADGSGRATLNTLTVS